MYFISSIYVYQSLNCFYLEVETIVANDILPIANCFDEICTKHISINFQMSIFLTNHLKNKCTKDNKTSIIRSKSCITKTIKLQKDK